MKRICLLLMLVLAVVGAWAREPRVVRVLAIGNSFSEDAVEQYLCDLDGEEVHFIVGNAFRAGQGLRSHWMDISTKRNTFEYRRIENGQRTVKKQQSLLSILQAEEWDFITLQQVSQDAGRPDSYEPYLTYMIDYVRSHARNPRMRLGFHMTWAYGPESTHLGFHYFNRNQLAMYDCIQQTAQWVMLAHREFDFLVPTGTALQSARTSMLGNDLTRDGYHLDKTIGRYIAACTWYEALLRRRVPKGAYHPVTISDAAAEIARKAAHKARRSPFKISDLSGEAEEEEKKPEELPWR